jgi:hypothetical protein
MTRPWLPRQPHLVVALVLQHWQPQQYLAPHERQQH